MTDFLKTLFSVLICMACTICFSIGLTEHDIAFAFFGLLPLFYFAMVGLIAFFGGKK